MVIEPDVEIPDRPLFKAAEVCELARVQPYVLRSWELEFPGLGVAKVSGGPRVYRRVDVEQVLHIRRLVFDEGLTLSGARRRIEEEAGGGASELPTVADLLGEDARRRLLDVKRGLQSLHEMLLTTPGAVVVGAAEAQVAKPAPSTVVATDQLGGGGAAAEVAPDARAGWPPRGVLADRPPRRGRK